MKIRTGFVSNSSSSSFIIRKSALTRKELDFIYTFKDAYCDYAFNSSILETDEFFIGEMEHTCSPCWNDDTPSYEKIFSNFFEHLDEKDFRIGGEECFYENDKGKLVNCYDEYNQH